MRHKQVRLGGNQSSVGAGEFLNENKSRQCQTGKGCICVFRYVLKNVTSVDYHR